ncbi:hypothetical protein L1887_40503 [Cichorium endivia]|nr:hypothetical protein L1887_40503 [Cichorium endivia]
MSVQFLVSARIRLAPPEGFTHAHTPQPSGQTFQRIYNCTQRQSYGATAEGDSCWVVRLGELRRLDRLGDGADLVDLEQQTVARLLLDGRLDAQGVGDRKVVADDGDAGVGAQVRPRLPVVLVEGVLDRGDRVLLDKAEVDVGELLAEPLGRVRVGVLEVEVVLALLVELGRGNVERDVHLALVAGLGDGLGEDLERLVGRLDVGSESALVTDVGGVNAVLGVDDLLEVVVHLGADLDRLGEALGARGDDHELLEGKGGGLDAAQVGEVLVEGETLLAGTGLGDGDRDTEDGVGAELALVGGAVELDQEVVDLLLRGDGEAGLDELGSDDVVDIVDGLGDALAHPGVLVAVAELDSLVDTGRSTGGDGGAEETLLGGDVDLDGGVTTRVEDHAGLDLLDSHFGCDDRVRIGCGCGGSVGGEG